MCYFGVAFSGWVLGPTEYFFPSLNMGSDTVEGERERERVEGGLGSDNTLLRLGGGDIGGSRHQGMRLCMLSKQTPFGQPSC